MQTYCSVTLVGSLARDVKFHPAGDNNEQPYAFITLLYTPYIGKNSDGSVKKADTISFDITLNGNDAVLANKYCRAKSQVIVEADPKELSGAYKDGQPVKADKGNGKHIVNFKLRAKTFRLADSAAERNTGGDNGPDETRSAAPSSSGQAKASANGKSTASTAILDDETDEGAPF